MGAPFDAKNFRLRVSSTENGTYNVVGYVRNSDTTEGSEGTDTKRWFGGKAIRAGNATLEGSFDVWYDREDTTGQALLRAAKRAGTTLWLQLCPVGTVAYAVVDQFEALITEIAGPNADAENENNAVEGSFSYEGDPDTLTEVTLA